LTSRPIDLDGKTILTSSGLWTIKLREPVCSGPAGTDVVKVEMSCGDRWQMVDLHIDRLTHFGHQRGDVGWILDSLRTWLSLPDAQKGPVVLLGRART
jgi:hypothetical protein